MLTPSTVLSTGQGSSASDQGAPGTEDDSARNSSETLVMPVGQPNHFDGYQSSSDSGQWFGPFDVDWGVQYDDEEDGSCSLCRSCIQYIFECFGSSVGSSGMHWLSLWVTSS